VCLIGHYIQGMPKKINFKDDLIEKLRDPEFAANYIMAYIVDKDLDLLPAALGDIARAYGVTKLAKQSGIHRRTLYKIFEANSNPSFELIVQILNQLGLTLEVKALEKTKRKRAG
jgi:probable addiction module antidote protein